MRTFFRIAIPLLFATFALQWILYFAYRSHDCGGRPYLVHQRQAVLCLNHAERFLWHGLDWALVALMAMIFTVVAAIAIASIFRKLRIG